MARILRARSLFSVFGATKLLASLQVRERTIARHSAAKNWPDRPAMRSWQSYDLPNSFGPTLPEISALPGLRYLRRAVAQRPRRRGCKPHQTRRGPASARSVRWVAETRSRHGTILDQQAKKQGLESNVRRLFQHEPRHRSLQHLA